MTHRLTSNYAKNYCNRTPIVKVIVENLVTCFFWDTVYKCVPSRIVTKSLIHTLTSRVKRHVANCGVSKSEVNNTFSHSASQCGIRNKRRNPH